LVKDCEHQTSRNEAVLIDYGSWSCTGGESTGDATFSLQYTSGGFQAPALLQSQWAHQFGEHELFSAPKLTDLNCGPRMTAQEESVNPSEEEKEALKILSRRVPCSLLNLPPTRVVLSDLG